MVSSCTFSVAAFFRCLPEEVVQISILIRVRFERENIARFVEYGFMAESPRTFLKKIIVLFLICASVWC